jgi:stress response protein YsnF
MVSDGCVTQNNSDQVKNLSTFNDRAASVVSAEDIEIYYRNVNRSKTKTSELLLSIMKMILI